MLYYKHKRKQPPTKWLTSSSIKAYLHRASDKVGLFIFACCSYQYRQAAQSGSYRPKITGLKSGMYPSAPPPLFFKFREATTVQHDCSSPIFYHILSFVTIPLLNFVKCPLKTVKISFVVIKAIKIY